MSRQIPLTRGLFATVDDADYESLSQYKWAALKGRCTFYAVRTSWPERRTVYMHAVIAGTPKGMQTDHVDGDGLNNQRANLRVVTAQQNAHNHSARLRHRRLAPGSGALHPQLPGGVH